MSIEMQHSERLTQSIDGLKASNAGCLVPILCISLILAILAVIGA